MSAELDITLLKEALRMTPAERIKAAEQLTRDALHLAAVAQRSRTRNPAETARIAQDRLEAFRPPQ